MSELFDPPSQPAPEQPGQPASPPGAAPAPAPAPLQGDSRDSATQPAAAGNAWLRPLIIVVLVIGVLGGGGYFAWQRDVLPVPGRIVQTTSQLAGKITTQVQSQVKRLSDRFTGDGSGPAQEPDAPPEKPLASAEADRLRADLAAAKTQLADLITSEDVAALAAKAKDIKDEIAGLEAEAAAGLKETTDLAARKIGLDAELEDLKKSQDDAASALEEIRIEQEAIRDDIDSRRKQSLRVIRRFEKVKVEIKARIEENDNLKADGEALSSEKEALTGEVETLNNSIEARKQVLIDLAGRLLAVIDQAGKQRESTLVALAEMEEYRQSHIERLDILRKEYIKIAARNVGIKRDRYRDIAADVSGDSKDFEEQTLEKPEEASALDEIAELVKKLQVDVAGVDENTVPESTGSPDAEPGNDADQDLPSADKDAENDSDQELPPPDVDAGNDSNQELPPLDKDAGNDPDQELPPPDADTGNDPDQELPPPDADPDGNPDEAPPPP